MCESCGATIHIELQQKNGPNPHPASLRSSNDPERSPSLIKRISRRTWHAPNPRWPAQKSAAQPALPYPLTPSPSPFSLSANTFSILTEALRSVSSLRCV